MDLQQTLSRIKKSTGEGNIEQALEQLIALLESDPKYGELAQAARVNQADLYQVKAQVLKSTISGEEARLATNQITDRVLQIVGRLEAGKLSLQETEKPPSRSQAWRYYIIGGLVTLIAVFFAWRFFHRSEPDGCPEYDSGTQYRVMILPFKKTGSEKNAEPEFEIVDGLNKLISRTSYLNADADVNEVYNIDQNYPSFSEAADIARSCGVQMIVWGKIDQNSAGEYKLDVFYKLLDEGVVQTTGDTTLSKLLKTRDEGQQLSRDAAAVTNLLYIVLANQARVPVLANLLDEMPPMPGATLPSAADTSWMLTMLALAENYKNNKQFEKAIDTYDQVLTVFPENQEARLKRGALLYQKGEYAAATYDLDLAAPDQQSANTDLLKIRSDAALKSGNPAKAVEDLNQIREKSDTEEPWLRDKFKEARDTMNVMRERLDDAEKKARTQPRDTKTQVEAAKISAGLGLHDKALDYSQKAVRYAPEDKDAVTLKVDALLAKGDTSAAKKAIQDAEKNGIKPATVEKWQPLLRRPNLPLLKRQ
ncbi:MAG: tetratricopeptide repeat protein [Lewinellaceae bacterium]|nr:tetratricopeptide repeat protein [Lewinellaceae bacterium]